MRNISFTEEEFDRLVQNQRREGMNRSILFWFVSTMIAAVVVGLAGDRIDTEKAVLIVSTVNGAALILSYFS